MTQRPIWGGLCLGFCSDTLWTVACTRTRKHICTGMLSDQIQSRLCNSTGWCRHPRMPAVTIWFRVVQLRTCFVAYLLLSLGGGRVSGVSPSVVLRVWCCRLWNCRVLEVLHLVRAEHVVLLPVPLEPLAILATSRYQACASPQQ